MSRDPEQAARAVERFEGGYARPEYLEAAALLEAFLGSSGMPGSPGLFFRTSELYGEERIIRPLNEQHRDDFRRLDVTAAMSGGAVWLLPSRDPVLIVEYWMTGASRHGSGQTLSSRSIASGIARLHAVAELEIETIHDDYVSGRVVVRPGVSGSQVSEIWQSLRDDLDPQSAGLEGDGRFFLNWED